MFNEVNELLNENKIKMMTKMAIYEKNEGKSMLKTAKYFKGDYIAFGVLKTVIATTFAGVILLAMYFLCNAEGMIRPPKFSLQIHKQLLRRPSAL